MIDLLGKRPFTNRADDMDKWLDENNRKRGEASAPPPIETEGPTPLPAFKKYEERLWVEV